MGAMNHFERVAAAIRGDPVDRVPISLWRHWPHADATARGLADAMVAWQRRYDFDLVKFMPTGTYGVHDWGAQTVVAPGNSGTRRVVAFGVTAAEQWPMLKPLDPGSGWLGQEVEALRLAACALDNRVPILQTVFSPLTTARKLAGDRVFADLRNHPAEFKAGLQIIADTTIRLMDAFLEVGAHGFFLASQCASVDLMSAADYAEFGATYDRQLLDHVQGRTGFTMFHIHGTNILFDLIADYPVAMLNWHDRLTAPTLAEAQTRFPGLLIGGINEHGTLLHGAPEAVAAEVRNAVAQTGGRRLLVGPGCVIPTNTPEANIRAAIAALAA
jgi:uroporphyrinogen decarboxylase